MLFQSRPYWLKNWDMRTVSGATAGPAVSTTANRNSFQAHRNANTPVPTSPGRASGSTMWRKDWKRLQPSSSAASSIAAGMLSKKPFSSQIAIGSAKAVSATISAE